jgi:hypothetical protein
MIPDKGLAIRLEQNGHESEGVTLRQRGMEPMGCIGVRRG